MGVIKINAGKIYDDVEDRNGNKIGEIAYDLENLETMYSFLGLYDKAIEKSEKLEKISNELRKDNSVTETGKPKFIDEEARLSLEFYNDLIKDFDNVFEEGFCQKATGGSKNPYLLLGVLEHMVKEFKKSQKQREDEMKKFIPQNREQKRAGNKK